MIIPGNALLALLSPPQESQGTREEEDGFGTLLTAIEQHATSRPDQEETERRALESVLQVLMNIFQSCTPANLLPVAAAPGTGESGVVSSPRHWTTRFPCAGWSEHGALSCDRRSAGELLLASSSAGECAGLAWTFYGPANGCIVRVHTDSRVEPTVRRAVARYDALLL